MINPRRRYLVSESVFELDKTILPKQLKSHIISTTGLLSPSWEQSKAALHELIEEIDREQAAYATFDDYFCDESMINKTQVVVRR